EEWVEDCYQYYPEGDEVSVDPLGEESPETEEGGAMLSRGRVQLQRGGRALRLSGTNANRRGYGRYGIPDRRFAGRDQFGL
ncbi:MAG: hypothetical protein IJM30_01040, partial [Thermoguttaceae bacterium]|nr:hypothetical protein [Thermoguttaceae bacterium]